MERVGANFKNLTKGFMSLGMGELLLILVIVFVLFGAGKLPQVMNDIGKSVKSLKKGLKDDEKSDEKTTREAQLEDKKKKSD
jgi:sec-independent protein translocase protein TatA